jgi:hypothetical protein
MPQQLRFSPIGIYISTDLNLYGEALLDLINVASQLKKVEFGTLKFTCRSSFDKSKLLTFKQILDYRIPIFDYVIFLNLTEEEREKVNWIVNKENLPYLESTVCFSVLYTYFMVLTRNKFNLNENEKIPSFLMKFMTVPMSIEDIKSCLSSNDLNLFNHNWIKSIDISTLSIALKNRIRQGIAGMRLFSIFRDYIPDKTLNSNLKDIHEIVSRVAKSGPYWEMHTLFQPLALSSISLNSNLNNLIIDCFSEEQIDIMIKQKSLYRKPIYNERTKAYLKWDSSFENLFVEKLHFGN